MESVLTAEGSLGLAITALVIALGWRFMAPNRGREFGAAFLYATSAALVFAAGRGIVPGARPVAAGLPLRLVGACLLVGGLLLAAASFRARTTAGRTHLAVGGPYARLRHPLYIGLGMVLVGHLLRAGRLEFGFCRLKCDARHPLCGCSARSGPTLCP